MKTPVILMLAVTCLSAKTCFADNYSVFIQAGLSELVGYNFQTNTISNAFPTMNVDGIMVFVYDEGAQGFDVATYVADYGWDEDLTLLPGRGFFIANTTTNDMTFYVYGTPMTADTYTLNLEANKYYLLGSAYPLDLQDNNFLECMYNVPPLYTGASLGYSANIGDEVSWWDADHYVQEIRTLTEDGEKKWIGEGLGISPSIVLPYPNEHTYGGAIRLLPAADTTWVHHKTGVNCY